MSDAMFFELELEQLSGYEFKVTFDKPRFAELLLDEPAPLGSDKGPVRGLLRRHRERAARVVDKGGSEVFAAG